MFSDELMSSLYAMLNNINNDVNNSINIYTISMNKLKNRLDEYNIDYIERDLYGGKQLLFKWCNADIICHKGSYGGDDGLFEVCGDELLTDDEKSIDSVCGYLTEDDAFNRILNAWNSKIN